MQLTEFEHRLWRVFNAFIRWQEACERYTNHTNLTGAELAILHVVRMKDRSKTAAEISQLLNRDDITNIQYSLRKLHKAGLIERIDEAETKGKYYGFRISKKGLENTDAYSQARGDTLITLFAEEYRDKNISMLGKMLAKLTGIYEEATRQAAIYNPPKLKSRSAAQKNKNTARKKLT